MTHTIWLAILVIIIFDFVVERLLDFLNDKEKSNVFPKEAKGIYDADRYALWLRYDKANGRLGMISSSLTFLMMLVIVYAGLLGKLDIALRNWIDHSVLLALCFFGVLACIGWIVGLPFQLYSTFVIEERFGFNRTSLKTFITDTIKGAILAILIGGPLLAFVILCFEYLAEDFWWVAWLVFSGFSIIMTMFAASWIMPLFNRFSPLPEGELRSAIEKYCAQVGFKVNRLFVIDGSKRSAKSNAFFSGLGPKKTIALYDTLIAQQTIDEIVAVLAHEVGHYKKQHILQGLLISFAQTGLMLYLIGVFLKWPDFAQALGAEVGSFHVGIIAFGLVFTPISTVLGIGMNVLSRKNEFEADAFAKATSNGDALISALKKLSSENLSNLKPHPLYVFVHYSHPPVLSRIARLKESTAAP
jgi:STE24 endopeptidase